MYKLVKEEKNALLIRIEELIFHHSKTCGFA